jgi:hypothetical protein
MQFRPKAPVTLPKGPAPIVFRTFTPTTLLDFNGVDGKPVYLAVRGRVFDVSPGRNFYGPVCAALCFIPFERQCGMLNVGILTISDTGWTL